MDKIVCVTGTYNNDEIPQILWELNGISRGTIYDVQDMRYIDQSMIGNSRSKEYLIKTDRNSLPRWYKDIHFITLTEYRRNQIEIILK